MRFIYKRIILLSLTVICSTLPLDIIDKEQLVDNLKSIRIIGGQDARAGQFPFAAAINATTPDSLNFCGGTLLSPLWILTAAHCIENATGIVVSLGSTSLENENDANRIRVSTMTFFLNPNYDSNTLDNNIALVKLRNSVQFSDYISKIYLPVEEYNEDINVVAMGWGQTIDDETGPVDHLNYVSLITISNEDCKRTYPTEFITNNTICAIGQYDEGTCMGDSGGPLVYFLNNRHPIIVGIGSFHSGLGCQKPHPSGFVRVYSNLDWILDVTDNLSDAVTFPD